MLKVLYAVNAVLEAPLRRRMSTAVINSRVLPLLKARMEKMSPRESECQEPRHRNIFVNHALSQCMRKTLQVPTVVGGDSIYTNDMQTLVCPHDISSRFAHVYYANRRQIEAAITAALGAQGAWGIVPVEERIKIWRAAANIIKKEDAFLVAIVVLSMGKSIEDAECDVHNLICALRSNADYLEHLGKLHFEIQGHMNVFPSFHLRPMDGFVAAVASFESVTQSAILALCPAIMGNTVLWNPAIEVAPASHFVYQAFMQAGLPKSVLNFVPGNQQLFMDTITDATLFSGLNYHGKAETYQSIFKLIGDKLRSYICFPRLSAECHGNSFHFVHNSADLKNVCEATIAAAFNFAGQYSNSLSRLYVPTSRWPELCQLLQLAIVDYKVGDPSLPETRIGPVINREGYKRLKALIKRVKNDKKLKIICGGDIDDTIGYSVQPTIVVVQDPLDPLLCEPIMGPVLPVFLYSDEALNEALHLAANQSKYALSGSIFARKDEVVAYCVNKLSMSASNLYINERCTGNAKGMAAFGGNRLSGTNDKSGTAYFLLRWCSPMLIEETISNPLEHAS